MGKGEFPAAQTHIPQEIVSVEMTPPPRSFATVMVVPVTSFTRPLRITSVPDPESADKAMSCIVLSNISSTDAPLWISFVLTNVTSFG